MKTKPIIFNTEMVKAILEGRKIQTRRVVNLKNNDLIFTGFIMSSTAKNREGCCAFGKNKEQDLELVKPKYKVGDVLYVREKFCTGVNIREKQNIPLNEDIEVLYYVNETNSQNSNCRDFAEIIKWKPSIHMPKKYARIFLKVTNVRVERLQNMKIEDFLDEGINNNGLIVKEPENGLNECYKYLKEKWISLWNSTAKDGYKWEDNPYVFVYEFERVEK